MNEPRRFILYDSRAADGVSTDDATIFMVCNSDAEAKKARGVYGGMACFSYAVKETPAGHANQLVDERFEWSWYPPKRRRGKKQRQGSTE